MSAIRSYEFQKWAFLLELLLFEIMAVYTRIFKNTKEKITFGWEKTVSVIEIYTIKKPNDKKWHSL